MPELFSRSNQSLQRIASRPLSFVIRYLNNVHYAIDDCVIRSRGRTSDRPDRNGRWFLSVCHRQAWAGRAEFNEHCNV